MSTLAAHEPVDVAVIGGGAAGLSAALVLSRARRRVAVVDAGQPRNAPAAHMHGFVSRDGMSPREFLAEAQREVRGYGADILEDTVAGVLRSGNGHFGLLLASGGTMAARRLLITTGLTDHTPQVPGLAERWGRDVLHCPYCHGYEVRDQPLGVIAGTPGAVSHALLLRQWTHDLVFFSHTSHITQDEREQLTARAVGIVDGEVAGLVIAHDRLTGVRLADGRSVPRAAVFVRPAFKGNDDFVAGLGGRTDEHGWPEAGPSGATTVSGVWVAGNAADPRAQVVTAAGQGSAAAIAINNDLTDEDVRDAVVAYRAGLPA